MKDKSHTTLNNIPDNEVQAIVNFPVPAKTFSQKIKRSCCSLAQLYISRRTSTRVLGRHIGSYCLRYELNGVSTAYGKRLSGVSSTSFCLVSYILQSFGAYLPRWCVSPRWALAPPPMWRYVGVGHLLASRETRVMELGFRGLGDHQVRLRSAS